MGLNGILDDVVNEKDRITINRNRAEDSGLARAAWYESSVTCACGKFTRIPSVIRINPRDSREYNPVNPEIMRSNIFAVFRPGMPITVSKEGQKHRKANG
ncbi:hypothetical protein CIRG_00694 [Coccidioides immitis RMSCC 2394]|uniref:Uncharacterized protein n=1 Tax=Coccidioides immitis RMSCC 2394 TaxID=404692 RepID=A0A0J7ATC9_COCIT|nr:hypothetical protein CIRG_00694 [Coccidioides immitis RMSCC 2394]